MATDTGSAGALIYTQADLDAALAEGIEEFQARQSTILGSAEGRANPKLAASLAAKANLSADEAIAILRDAGPSAADRAEEFKRRKLADDGLSFADPVGSEPSGAEGWGRAFARVNGDRK